MRGCETFSPHILPVQNGGRINLYHQKMYWLKTTVFPSVLLERRSMDLSRKGCLSVVKGQERIWRQPSFDATLFRFFQIRSLDGTRSSIPSSQLVLRTVTTAPREAKHALDVNDVINIIRLRSLADEPILYEEIYIPTDRFRGFEALP